MKKPNKKKILVTPLNWGLGHATRCIPIINTLIKQGYEPIIASDGDALFLLQKEFPNLKSFELPSYNIAYPKHTLLFTWHFIVKIPAFIKTYKSEQKTIKKIVNQENIKGIISDNRFGCFHSDIKSVYITHQLKVFSGVFTFFTSKIHQNIIKRFDVCWVPDNANNLLSGKLSNIKSATLRIKYIGILSRFKPKKVKIRYDYLVLLSGVESQRSQLEKILLNTFTNTNFKVLFIQGKLGNKQITSTKNNLTILNYTTAESLQKIIAQSKIIISRPGYSTIMDLAAMGKKAFFIPTPGQYEQIYLAKILSKKKIVPFIWQRQFKITDLNKIKKFTGFKQMQQSNNLLIQALTIFDGC